MSGLFNNGGGNIIRDGSVASRNRVSEEDQYSVVYEN